MFDFFVIFRKKKKGVAVPQANINCQAGSIALAKHVYIVFLGAFKRHSFFFIDFMVKPYDFINCLYHFANPVWQNKVKKTTASYRGFILLLIHIIL